MGLYHEHFRNFEIFHDQKLIHGQTDEIQSLTIFFKLKAF